MKRIISLLLVMVMVMVLSVMPVTTMAKEEASTDGNEVPVVVEEAHGILSEEVNLESVEGVRAAAQTGYCGGFSDGTNLTWNLDGNTLTISGLR